MADTEENPAKKTGGNPGPRGSNGRYVPSVEAALRDAQAVALRRDGVSYANIAAELGYPSAGNAYNGIQRALLSIVKEAGEELVQLELERLDMMWRTVLKVLRRKHLTVQNGRVVTTDDGEPVIDDAPVLAAVDRLLRIMERRAAYTGVDKAKKVEIITMDMIDAEIMRLKASLDSGATTTKEHAVTS